MSKTLQSRVSPEDIAVMLTGTVFSRSVKFAALLLFSGHVAMLPMSRLQAYGEGSFKLGSQP